MLIVFEVVEDLVDDFCFSLWLTYSHFKLVVYSGRVEDLLFFLLSSFILLMRMSLSGLVYSH